MDYAKIFADNVRRARHEAGLSQEKLGEMCDLARNHIGAIERREHSPRLESMDSIAKALGVSLLDLLSQPDC